MATEPPVSQVQFDNATVMSSRQGLRSRHSGEARADSFEETLAWVRAKSAERRRKYRRHGGDQKNADCSKLTDKIVTESLERGRAALADAEAHMKRFEQYVNPPKEEQSDEYGRDVLNFASRAAQKVVENIKEDEPPGTTWYSHPRASLDSDNSSTQTVRTDSSANGPKAVEEDNAAPSQPLHSDGFSTRLQELLGSDCKPCQVSSGGVSSDARSSIEAAQDQGRFHPLPERVPADFRLDSPHRGMTAYRGGTEDPLGDGRTDSLVAPAMINAVIYEGEKRVRREEQLAAARRRGDKTDLRDTGACGGAKKTNLMRPGTAGRKRPSPTACIFDPDQLKGAKRSALKAAARAEEEAAVEAEANKKALFKARPLPQGGSVQNDPYALTKAAMGKIVSSGVEEGGEADLIRQGSKGAIRMDASVLLENRRVPSLRKVNSDGEQSRFGGDTIDSIKLASKTRKRRQMSCRNAVRIEKFVKAQEILDSVDKSICFHEDDDDEEETGWASDEDVLAISELQHRIERMEAELRHKQELCQETATRIEDLSEPLVNDSGAANQQGHHQQAEGNFDSFDCDVLRFDDLSEGSEEDFADKASSNSIQTEDASLFQRHEKWVERRRKKLEDVRLQKADEAMKDVTGRPRLDGTKESWLKAKAAHNEADPDS